jgi:hypothetical protein
MSDDTDRALAVELFNRAWDLIDKTDRSADEGLEMLLAAAASRWHWGRAGGPEQWAAGDWQVAHCASLLGLGDVALAFASRNLATAEAEGWTGWRLASAHEGVARACAAAGDWAGRNRHADLCQQALDAEPDDEDRAVIASQLATVPHS